MPETNKAYLSWTWAWHSSAPACYYYYYDYLDSGIDISHELSNSETAGYETLPTPLWLVSKHPHNSTEDEDIKEREDHSKSEVATDSVTTIGGEETILNNAKTYSDNTGDSDDTIDNKSIVVLWLWEHLLK